MFEIGFWEITLIGIVALLVVGPERLPALARTAGYWVGKLRRMVAQVKEDVEREIHADELKRTLEAKKEELSDVYSAIDEAKSGLTKATHGFANELSAEVAKPEIESSQAMRTEESASPSEKEEKSDSTVSVNPQA